MSLCSALLQLKLFEGVGSGGQILALTRACLCGAQVYHYLVEKLYKGRPIKPGTIIGYDDACHLLRFLRAHNRLKQPRNKEVNEKMRFVGALRNLGRYKAR